MASASDSEPQRPLHHRTATGQAQRAKTRTMIIRAAIPVFAEHGPDSPVIDQFASAAGISRGTFYNYFATTRELLQAAMDLLADDLIGTIVPAVEGETNPVVRLATAARLYYRQARLDPLLGRFMDSISGVGALASEHGRQDLEEAIAQKLVQVPDMALAAAIAYGVMVFALRAPNAQEDIDQRATEVVRAILRGLGVKPSLIERALAIPLPPVAPFPRG